jgi:two-component system phosphate regulon sensor histidine kinase PhoR
MSISNNTASTVPAGTPEQFEHERLMSLINSMVDGVVAVNEHAEVDIYNGAALNILDLNSSMKGKSLSEVCNLLDTNNQPVDIVKLVYAAKTAFVSRDYALSYVDGSKVSLYLSIAPVHLGYGKAGTQSYVIVLRDISHEKSLEQERDEFISVVSHELRTPITIAEGNISNAQYIVNKAGGDELIKKALEDAHQQTLFLADMINDLSTLSRAERGKLTVDIESINVHDLLTELAHMYSPEAEAKGLRIHTALGTDLELLMSGKLYVREILQNFITNAIKYTNDGRITLGAEPADKGVSIWIEDTGIGISKSDQEKIYDKFFRSENYETRKTSGTGLGLYVTMKLARLLHADITTHSQLGKGSKFTIFLPDLQ